MTKLIKNYLTKMRRLNPGMSRDAAISQLAVCAEVSSRTIYRILSGNKNANGKSIKNQAAIVASIRAAIKRLTGAE